MGDHLSNIVSIFWVLALLLANVPTPPSLHTLVSSAEATESNAPGDPATLIVMSGTTTRVSVASDGTQGNDNSPGADNLSISSDGRYVAFYSYASNLVSGDTNGYTDVFVYDRQTGQTIRVSVASDGIQGNRESASPSLSADGRFVTFSSYASNLVAGDTNGFNDFFAHDLQTGQTTRVSVASDGTQGNSGCPGVTSISADGRYVAFASNSSNLVSGDTNSRTDIFVHDRQAGQTTRVSIASNGTQGNLASDKPIISADGRYVAFSSSADNLVSGDTNGYSDVFVHDRQTGQTTRASVASDGSQGNNVSWGPSISGDGRYVAFVSYASNLVSGDTNGTRDVFVHDRQTGQTIRVSVASDGTQGDSDSMELSISSDGRYVAFWSTASNLVGGDTNGCGDVFVHDRQTGQTTRISVASNETQGSGASYAPAISGDGDCVAFASDASNLVADDTNGKTDIFVHDRTIPGIPFLDLPVDYSDTNFATAALGNTGKNPGRVNSWFDHTSPDYNSNGDITLWRDTRYTTATIDICTLGVSCYDGHNGIDFQQSTPNEPIYAAATGIVTEVHRIWPTAYGARGGSYGNYVLIDHGDGYATFYAHLASVNDNINRDTRITDTKAIPLGIMGGTGGHPVHLHFGVYYDANRNGIWEENYQGYSEVVDPYGWIGSTSDPWDITSLYLWKYSLWTQRVLGNLGGSISSPSGNMNVVIPSDALTSTITLELWDVPPIAEPSAQLRSTGRSFWLRVLEWLAGSRANESMTAVSSGFAQPVTITVTYSDTEALHLSESQLTIHRWSESSNAWVALPTTVDVGQNRVVAQTTEIGDFDLQAPLLCPADTTEPDDNYYAAVTVQTEGTPVSRLFDVAQDEDWSRCN